MGKGERASDGHGDPEHCIVSTFHRHPGVKRQRLLVSPGTEPGTRPSQGAAGPSGAAAAPLGDAGGSRLSPAPAFPAPAPRCPRAGERNAGAGGEEPAPNVSGAAGIMPEGWTLTEKIRCP